MTNKGFFREREYEGTKFIFKDDFSHCFLCVFGREKRTYGVPAYCLGRSSAIQTVVQYHYTTLTSQPPANLLSSGSLRLSAAQLSWRGMSNSTPYSLFSLVSGLGQPLINHIVMPGKSNIFNHRGAERDAAIQSRDSRLQHGHLISMVSHSGLRTGTISSHFGNVYRPMSVAHRGYSQAKSSWFRVCKFSALIQKYSCQKIT